MARATVVQSTPGGPYDAAPHAELVFAAGNVADGNQVRLTGDQVLVAYNTGVGANTITIASSPIKGRLGDITAYSIAAGKYRVFAQFPMAGWAQTNGYLNVNVEDAEILLAVINLANSHMYAP